MRDLGILELLRSTGSIIINKKLARNIGLNNTILFGELVSKLHYYIEHDMLEEDEFFYVTVEDLEYETTLSKKQQQACMKTLEELNLIKVTYKGIPRRRYIKVVADIENIISLLDNSHWGKKVPTSGEKITPTLGQKSAHINNTNNNTKEINNYIMESPKTTPLEKENKKTKKGLISEIKKSKSTKEDKKEQILKLINTLDFGDKVLNTLEEHFLNRVEGYTRINLVQWRTIINTFSERCKNDEEAMSFLTWAMEHNSDIIIPTSHKDTKGTMQEAINKKFGKTTSKNLYRDNIKKDKGISETEEKTTIIKRKL